MSTLKNDLNPSFPFIPTPLWERYRNSDQCHIFEGIDDLSIEERNIFLSTLDELPLENILESFNNAKKSLISSDRPSTTLSSYQPLRPEDLIVPGHEIKDLWNIGLDAIREGKMAVVCLAGGQGTRLGSSNPKGTYDIGLPSHRSLFELQALRLLKLSALSNPSLENYSCIPWFIMTSDATHQETISFFEENNYFSYQKNRIRFFKQGLFPSLSEDGLLLLQKKGILSMSPNGNGGIYEAMSYSATNFKVTSPSRSTMPISSSLPCESSILDDMECLSIDYVHMYCVDNCLVRVCDPYFLGACILKGTDCAAKSILKVDAKESVGVFCHKNGSSKITVAEYSEIPEELSMKLLDSSSSSLLFNQANIANHFFKVSFLRKSSNVSLPIHLAHKKIKCLPINSDLHLNDNDNDNTQMGYKMEQFIFDIFELANNPIIYQGNREEEFAALKNAPGNKVDSPEYCRDMLLSLHKKWMIQANPSRIISDNVLEISPMVSYAGEGLQE